MKKIAVAELGSTSFVTVHAAKQAFLNCQIDLVSPPKPLIVNQMK